MGCRSSKPRAGAMDQGGEAALGRNSGWWQLFSEWRYLQQLHNQSPGTRHRHIRLGCTACFRMGITDHLLKTDWKQCPSVCFRIDQGESSFFHLASDGVSVETRKARRQK